MLLCAAGLNPFWFPTDRSERPICVCVCVVQAGSVLKGSDCWECKRSSVIGGDACLLDYNWFCVILRVCVCALRVVCPECNSAVSRG